MSREIDVLVAEKVMGWIPWTSPVVKNGVPDCWLTDDKRNPTVRMDWSPSIDIAAAWDVVNKMLAGGWEPNIDYDIDHKRWECVMGHMAYNAGYADAKTAPRAICLAVLKAVGVEIATS